ncbi:MAG TPA: hypothetical protein VMK12_21025 [Anaeromyxobacteraceae bacterium]|nr:hypothetical protein [Anaeromyxobacteraceae bacterium]
MLRIDVAIRAELADTLMEVARYDAMCASFRLAPHVRQRLAAQGDLRWVHAVATREGLNASGHEIVMALQRRLPACVAPWQPAVCAIAELAAMVRRLSGFTRNTGLGAIVRLHEHLEPDPAFRTASRTVWYAAGVPEVVPRAKIGEHIERLSAWYEGTPFGNSPVIGVAVVHQELMHLCPFPARTVGAVDALTRCVLMQRGVNRSGVGVLERQFAWNAEKYGNAIRVSGDKGRERWLLHFARALLEAQRGACKEIEGARIHLERKRGLDAQPSYEREQAIYDFILHKRGATSAEVARVLGDRATNMRMVQRDLTRLAEIGLIEKLGARKNAWYRPRGLMPDCDFEPIDGGVEVSAGGRARG